ncbi:NUDIX hydrolase domain-containing protein [Pochonia chlamydosporia 170]|uniref:NUDIX hydrolase domain-containing protein n=1 Tax=Pochonia chlamydosporia 170 TaxID=1380566 RepID=A0A179FFP8_METCM|nr:NUDIX hydrolase domain-containing protein [Pochonia chlamydosporia 170]OAQ64120.1 NUDIX hydrolase domain-containing protein [Pochonia chlamydosporia 170]
MASPAPKVRVGVGVFVLASKNEDRENPRFLIGKRKGSHGAGTYALPGGHLEFGEETEDCATRELLEETGLKVTDIRFMTATNDYMPDDNKHYITLFHVCVRQNDDDEAQLLEPDKCESWEWVTWNDLLEWTKAQQDPSREGEALKHKLFIPLLNLAKQRPGIRPTDLC